MKENVIEFLRVKDFKFIKNIGQGGTGKTILIEDETIGEKFVCKKYSPFYKKDVQAYFANFVDEIKLLHLLFHRNVVRVFNYYLYPQKTTGYILMEYIDGEKISDFLKKNPEKLDDIFLQTIAAFRHLEENNILHRDIRPENLMVSYNGILKVIDFGFGKRIDFHENFENSVSLNWRYPIPKEFEAKSYNFKTEVYFVGKLFEELIHDNDLQNFSYSAILSKMISFSQEKRFPSFFDVDREIISGNITGIEFSHYEKEAYINFARALNSLYVKIESTAEYIKDIDLIISSLEDNYRNSMLEQYVQNPASVVRCFMRGSYYYNKKGELPVYCLKTFLQFIKSCSFDKRRKILNNLWQRLDAIERYTSYDDDLPF